MERLLQRIISVTTEQVAIQQRREGGGVALIHCQLPIDHASLLRWSTVPAPSRDFYDLLGAHHASSILPFQLPHVPSYSTGGGGCIMHSRKLKTIDPRIPKIPGWSSSAFSVQARAACTKGGGGVFNLCMAVVI